MTVVRAAVLELADLAADDGLCRGVPQHSLLLWILVILAIFTEVLPPPNAYRGENPAASMILFDTIAPTNRYTAIPSLAMTNPPGVIPLGREGISWAVVAFALAIAAALIGRHFLNARAQRIQDATGQRPTTWWINLAMLVAPVLALIWYYGLHLVRPELKGFNFVGGLTLDNAFVVLWLALTLTPAPSSPRSSAAASCRQQGPKPRPPLRLACVRAAPCRW